MKRFTYLEKYLKKARKTFPPMIPGYTLGRRLGVGGMGVVFLAERNSDRALVAIKFLLPDQALNPLARKVFVREQGSMWLLRHRNLVAFLDNGIVGDIPWFVMEYCHHGDLDGLVWRKGGRIPALFAAKITRQVLDGLEALHLAGLVHRDLKPENVFLTTVSGEGLVKVADFGLAHSYENAGVGSLTAQGTWMGSPPFMSREQLEDFSGVGPAADLWAAGATLYFMLSGQFTREFPEGSLDNAIAAAEIVDTAPIIPLRARLEGVDHDVPDALFDVVERAVHPTAEPSPKGRFATAAEFRDALAAAIPTVGSSAKGP
ncbi:MAG: serine/threonine protein kinase [Deltaproteobacteria bacterium]|nr:serine/threonine protein kinase [Deltaproteobacteria bacterium]